MVHNDRKHNCFCRDCGAPAAKGYIVRFGREITNRFRTYPEAAQFLTGLRHEEGKGTLDKRDYQKDQPLSFQSQINNWLSIKKREVKPTTSRNLSRYINRACDCIGNKNVKAITNGDIEDFLFADSTANSDKTRADIRSCVNQFFTWLEDREGIRKPRIPKISYELGFRNFTDLDTQRAIIDQLALSAPPKAVFGIELLATYPKLRPDDLRRIEEQDFDGEFVFIRYPTKKKNGVKTFRLLPEDAERWSELSKQHPALPHMPFFRHHCTLNAKEDTLFGKDFLYRLWKKACAELGIEGLDLYGGTRHTTVTAIAKMAGRDNAKKASAHETNKAFERYCQAEDETAFAMAEMIRRPKSCSNVVRSKKKFNKN